MKAIRRQYAQIDFPSDVGMDGPYRYLTLS
jgi:hypothetical protein